MTESSFIRSVHRLLPNEVYRWKIKADYTDGVPDCWYSGEEGGHLFVEYKFVSELPVRPGTLVRAELSSLQFDWLSSRRKRGIPVAVIVGTRSGGVFFTDIEEARDGIPRSEFEDRIVSKAQLAETISLRVGLGKGTKNNGPPSNREENHAPRP